MVVNERISWVGLPKIDINTQTNNTVGFTAFAQTDIDNVTKRNCAATFTDGYGSNFFPGGFTTNITIKGRGNFTWSRAKKPYNVVICGTADFSKRSVAMFGMPSDSDWSILAEYDDFTQGRTILASAWSFALGQWGSRCVKAELFFNGAYYGLVTFCEKVTRTTARINIVKLNPTDVTGAAVTGGYVLEGQDASYNKTGEQNFVDARFGLNYTFKVPDPDVVVGAQVTYAKNYLDDFLTRLYTQPFTDLTNGYRAVADPATLAQYLLLQDLMHNGDGNSFYLTKDRNGKLLGGPFWDAGVIFGALETAWGPNVVNPVYDGLQGEKVPWWNKLLSDSYFVQTLKDQLTQSLPKLHRAHADLRDYLAKLNGTQTMTNGVSAIGRDAALWAHEDGLFVGNFARNVPRMLDFIERRLYWLTRQKWQLSV